MTKKNYQSGVKILSLIKRFQEMLTCQYEIGDLHSHFGGKNRRVSSVVSDQIRQQL